MGGPAPRNLTDAISARWADRTGHRRPHTLVRRRPSTNYLVVSVGLQASKAASKLGLKCSLSSAESDSHTA